MRRFDRASVAGGAHTRQIGLWYPVVSGDRHSTRAYPAIQLLWIDIAVLGSLETSLNAVEYCDQEGPKTQRRMGGEKKLAQDTTCSDGACSAGPSFVPWASAS